MQTEITRLLGIKYPIIQGGMAWVAEHHLAAAVSEAGGLGLIGAASAPAEWVREQIRAARKLTDKPFGVNIMLMSPYAADVAKVIVEEGVQVVTTGPFTLQEILAQDGRIFWRIVSFPKKLFRQKTRYTGNFQHIGFSFYLVLFFHKNILKIYFTNAFTFL